MAETTSTIDRGELNSELFPPEGDKDLGYKVFEILAEVVKFKDTLGLPAKWNRNYELWKNRHWRNPKKNVPLVTANILTTHITRTKNTLTDNNPTFNVRQVGKVDEEKENIFELLLRTAEFWWSDQEQQSLLEESVQNGEIYGCTIEKASWNPELEGIGEVEIETVDPYYFGVWPTKCKDVQKADAVFHYRPMTVREARRMWPEMAHKIRSDRQYLSELGDERLEIAGAAKGRKGLLSTFAGVVKNLVNVAGSSTDAAKDEVLVVEVWVKDYSREQVEEDKFQDKYPGKIRMIQTCNGGEVVLADKPNPSINPTLDAVQASNTYLWDKFPFSCTPSQKDTTNIYGMSDAEQLEMLNMEINKTLSQFTLIKDRVARIKLINPKDTGVASSEFTNAPGIIEPKNSLVAQAIRYLDSPRIPPELGREVIAYKAIAALLERAATMLKGKIRGYSKMIRIRGRMYLSMVMNWYTEERYISYELDGEEITEAITGHDMIIPAKLNVISGSTMPISKVQEREEAAVLFEKGAIDNEELLKRIDWPDWKRVISRMKMGPIGEFLQKLQMLGFPPLFLQYLTEIADMDMKEFERALEKGELAMLPDLLAPTADEQAEMPPSADETMAQMEIAKLDAEVAKVEAEVALIIEKINTEKVEQSVKIAGIGFDKQKLAIERAGMVAEIRKSEADKNLVEKTDPNKSGGNGDGKKKTDVSGPRKATKTANKRNQGPHDERGMKSNNQR
jgi:hypothetical protein